MKFSSRGLRLLALLVLGLPLVAGYSPAAAQTGFTDPAFQRTWERTDKPVADGRAQRSWYWGPQPNFSTVEPYAQAPGGQRKVQYFDKTRMEINNPAGDPTNPFYVTNGLLANELMSGQMQTGDNTYESRCPANIPLASDGDDTVGPTYATFGTLKNAAKSNQVGQKALATTDRAGNVGTDAGKANTAGIDLVYNETITGRNIPKVFWEFLNAQGVVYANGQYTNAQINQPWFFASGLPVTEAYWAKAKIGGNQLDVLVQAYERRILTFIPAYAGTPFAVQMGNVGQHYYDWRYKGVGCAGGPGPQPTAPVGQPTAPPVVPTPAPIPPTTTAADCSGIPDPKNATVTPNCGPANTRFNIRIRGFSNDERISFWLTAPNGLVVGTVRPLNIGSHGSELDDFIDGSDLAGLTNNPNGIWAVTYQGESSGNQSVVWFKLVPNGSSGPPPTQPPAAACDTSGTRNATINPTSGPIGTNYTMTLSGFTPGEQVGYWFTDPDGAVFGTTRTYTIGASSVTLPFNSRDFDLYPGRWAFTMQGTSSGNVAVAVFCVTP